jgi:hypothetical protein
MISILILTLTTYLFGFLLVSLVQLPPDKKAKEPGVRGVIAGTRANVAVSGSARERSNVIKKGNST